MQQLGLVRSPVVVFPDEGTEVSCSLKFSPKKGIEVGELCPPVAVSTAWICCQGFATSVCSVQVGRGSRSGLHRLECS